MWDPKSYVSVGCPIVSSKMGLKTFQDVPLEGCDAECAYTIESNNSVANIQPQPDLRERENPSVETESFRELASHSLLPRYNAWASHGNFDGHDRGVIDDDVCVEDLEKDARVLHRIRKGPEMLSKSIHPLRYASFQLERMFAQASFLTNYHAKAWSV